jgi:mono/diheme cytochrome c family protein
MTRSWGTMVSNGRISKWHAGGLLLLAIAVEACGGEGRSQNALPPDEIQRALPRIAADAPADVAGGKELFELNCSSCHGPVANGSDLGPPLVDVIYEPRHHADVAFVLAVRNGVRAHHWRFGNMPPLPGVTEPMVQEIVGYVRWLQRQVGIE